MFSKDRKAPIATMLAIDSIASTVACCLWGMGECWGEGLAYR